MTTPSRSARRAHRVPVPPAAGAGFDHDYGDAFAVTALADDHANRADAPALRWAELGLAGAEQAHRLFARLAWQLGLGFALEPRGRAGTLAGWRIVDDTPDRLVLDCDGRLMAGRMVFLRERPGAADDRDDSVATVSSVTWSTMLRFHRATGRRVWMLFGPAHRTVTPLALGRARRALSRG